MKQLFNKLIKYFSNHPQQLFLIDGIGACLSAFILGVVLVRLESFFGIPIPVLYFLALFPVVFAIYDLSCYRKKSMDFRLFLKIIAALNLSYCSLSLGLAVYHYKALTAWGWTYLLLEIHLVVALACLELKIASVNHTA